MKTPVVLGFEDFQINDGIYTRRVTHPDFTGQNLLRSGLSQSLPYHTSPHSPFIMSFNKLVNPQTWVP